MIKSVKVFDATASTTTTTHQVPKHINVSMNEMIRIIDGVPYNLPDNYKDLLIKLRSMLPEYMIDPDIHADDVFLFRFLKGSIFDVHKTAIMVSEHLLWRLQEGIHDILVHEERIRRFQKFLKVFKMNIHGVSKSGEIGVVIQAGMWDSGEIFSLGSQEEILKDFIFYQEYMLRLVKQESHTRGSQNHSLIYMIDLKGFSLTTLSKKLLSLFKRLSSIGNKYYPDTVYKTLILNPPIYFKSIAFLLYPILSSGTKETILLISYRNIISTLEDYFVSEAIPSYMGGTCACEWCLFIRT